MAPFRAELANFQVDCGFPVPVIEELASADVGGVSLRGDARVEGVRFRENRQSGNEISGMALGSLRGKEYLEGTVIIDLDLAAIHPPGPAAD